MLRHEEQAKQREDVVRHTFGGKVDPVHLTIVGEDVPDLLGLHVRWDPAQVDHSSAIVGLLELAELLL